jgi:hypothetical protein
MRSNSVYLGLFLVLTLILSVGTVPVVAAATASERLRRARRRPSHRRWKNGGLKQVQFAATGDCLGTILSAQLGGDIVHVRLGRAQGDGQRTGDLLVCATLG